MTGEHGSTLNSAFCKTLLLKKKRSSDRLSLFFIPKVQIYNPLSALMLTLVNHLCHVPLRVAINPVVTISTRVGPGSRLCHLRTQCCYSYRLFKETNGIVHKNFFWEIYRCKVVQFFTEQPLILFCLYDFF